MNRWIVFSILVVFFYLLYIWGGVNVVGIYGDIDQGRGIGVAIGCSLGIIIIYSIIKSIIKKIYKVCKRQRAEGESPPLSPP